MYLHCVWLVAMCQPSLIFFPNTFFTYHYQQIWTVEGLSYPFRSNLSPLSLPRQWVFIVQLCGLFLPGQF